ncbi:MAG TPA: transcriptional regulator GcvA [Acidobacteriaceae bacterium]
MLFRKLPPLSALAAFEAVARHRSFTNAGKELFLTHGAVSQRISLLEKHLNTRLFARSNRAVELTAEGARYLEAVRDALSKLTSASDQFSQDGKRQLRLSVTPIFARHCLARRLSDFHRLHPSIDLDIRSLPQYANISAGEVDIAISWGNGNWPGVEKIRLIPGEFFPVCSEAYRKEKEPLKIPADLRRTTLLRHSRIPWKPWFKYAGLECEEPSAGPCFDDIGLMLQAAVDGLGVALAHRLLVEGMLEDGRLVRLFDISSFGGEDAIYVVYAKESMHREEVAVFVNWITAAIKHDIGSSVDLESSEAAHAGGEDGCLLPAR